RSPPTCTPGASTLSLHDALPIWRLDDEVAPVLLVLAPPDELGIEVAVAALVGHAQRLLGFLLDDRLVFRGRDVPALGLSVTVRLDRKSTRLNSSHVAISYGVFFL